MNEIHPVYAIVTTYFIFAILTYGYAFNHTKDTGVVGWVTNIPATGRMYYGTSATALSKTVEVTVLNTNQQVSVTGLEPRKKYYYQIEAVDVDGKTVKSPVSEFRTRK